MHSVMDIPEIILLIGDSLPRCSLATCVRVCKLWHKLLAPLLYRTINSLYRPSPSIEGMARHVEHIRNLILQLHEEAPLMEDGISVFLSHPIQCRGLHTLTILGVGHDNRHGKSSCEALILLNQQLRYLDICNGDLTSQLSWRVVFSQCSPFLQTLTLSGSRLSKKETAQLMELGRRLKSLDISDCHCVWSEFTVEPQFPMMTSLKISGLFKRPAQELCWFVQCPQLRTLDWKIYRIIHDMFATGLEFRNLQSRPWKQLQRLELTSNLSDSQLAQIMTACSPLREVSIMKSGFWLRSLAALEKHSETLEGLRLYEGDGLRSWMCHWIAASFPKLGSLKVGRVFAHELVMGSRAEEARRSQLAKDTIDDDEMLQKEIATGQHEMVDVLNEAMVRFAAMRDVLGVRPWVCLKLVHLTMCFAFPLEQAMVDWDEQVFRQISKLDCLESLNLGQSVIHDENTRGLQLKAQSGLILLAPLKKLVTLKFVGTHQNLDEQDLLWILNQWPSLREISGGLHEDKEIREKLWPFVKARGIELLLPSYEFEDGSEDEYEVDEDFYSDF
ncbi:MAG: hypothetical protein J3R72DRAFT_457058, partial [Linnemannia gamsii]